MLDHFPKNLTIRTAVVRKPNTGYILACDPKMEKQSLPHTYTFTWKNQQFQRGRLNFDAHTSCIISDPEPAWVMVAAFGEYAITSPNQRIAGNMFENLDKSPRKGPIRQVSQIGGKAYAVGHKGTVLKLDNFNMWIRLDKNLPSDFKITSIDGFGPDDIYAVGYQGMVCHFDGKQWNRIDFPASGNLTSVKCTENKKVYVAGYNGILFSGRGNTWNKACEDYSQENFWDIEWFQGNIYVSSMSFLYQLGNTGLQRVVFNDPFPETFYQLSVAEGILWSIGDKDIFSFDGNKWRRVV